MMFNFTFDLSTVLVFITTFLITLTWCQSKSKSGQKLNRYARMPPGPKGLPIFGNLLSLGINPHLTLIEMAKKYGNVFTIKMASESIVVLNGYQAVKDALVKKSLQFAGRPKMALTEELTKGKGIVTADYGETWKTQRKFTLKTLRSLGMGKSEMEQNVVAEIECLTKAFMDKKSESFEINKFLEVSIANILCAVVFGTRYDYSDDKFLTLLHVVTRFCEIGAKASVINFFPWLKYMPCGPIKEMFTNNEIMTRYVKRVIKEHQDTIDYNELRDFIDTYLNEIHQQNNNIKGQSSFTEEYLFYLLIDLFFAGTETMSVTLRWAFLYMIVFPDIQSKVQAEIDEVVGKDRLPSLADRARMPYTEATMLEIQRMANITALTFPHKTLDDVQLYGYDIPKDTTVFVNLYSIHVDETQWKDPHQFDPHRFLNKDGGVEHNPALMTFSAGRRRCPGEELARSELFLFFTGILQRFQFKVPDGQSTPSLEKVFGISLVPHPYQVQAVPRHTQEVMSSN